MMSNWKSQIVTSIFYKVTVCDLRTGFANCGTAKCESIMAKTVKELMIPDELVMNKIYFVRGQKIMLDRDLAELYGVETKVLNQAIKRNANRFPEDFMFQLTWTEFENLKSQIVTSSWGGVRKLPNAFTEQGVAMLSSVLKSETAIRVNIQIIRVFTRMREMIMKHKDILVQLEKMEK